MAGKRTISVSDDQLELFAPNGAAHERTDSIRNDGRETLARTLPEDGARIGGEGAAASDAARSRGEDKGRDGHAANGVDAAGVDDRSGPSPGMGDGAREIHPAPARVLGPAVGGPAVSRPAVGHKFPRREE